MTINGASRVTTRRRRRRRKANRYRPAIHDLHRRRAAGRARAARVGRASSSIARAIWRSRVLERRPHFGDALAGQILEIACFENVRDAVPDVLCQAGFEIALQQAQRDCSPPDRCARPRSGFSAPRARCPGRRRPARRRYGPSAPKARRSSLVLVAAGEWRQAEAAVPTQVAETLSVARECRTCGAADVGASIARSALSSRRIAPSRDSSASLAGRSSRAPPDCSMRKTLRGAAIPTPRANLEFGD